MRILFATDGSRGASLAEDFLLALPLSRADEVVVLNVPVGNERESYALLSRCRWRFAARDILTTTVIRAGHPAEVVETVAFEYQSELIVVGSRGFGTITGALMGSVARALTRNAPAPVLVVRAHRNAPRRVLLAVDGSADARAAVELVARLPLPRESRITVLQLGDPADPQTQWVQRHARALLGERVIGEDAVLGGPVGEHVLRRATLSGSDVIVLGARDQTVGVGLLGTSLADHVTSHACCAVLIAKPSLARRNAESSVASKAVPAI